MNDWAEFRHFRYLLAILEHKGLRAASEHLRTAEPNLSVQAKQFQEAFAIKLFRKGKDRRIRLTETGVAFKVIARGLLDARDEAIAALIAIERGEIRSVNLGCSSFVDAGLLDAARELHKEMVPGCTMRLTHGDPIELVDELASNAIDAAFITLPISDPRLHVETVRRDRLVACLRMDHALAAKTLLCPADLQGNLTIFYHPQRHPSAHSQLIELLGQVGVQVDEFSRASHPADLLYLVRAGYGLALVPERSVLDADLTTRPVAGVDWAVDTAFVFNKQAHPKTIPVLARHLKRRLTTPDLRAGGPTPAAAPLPRFGSAKYLPRSVAKDSRNGPDRRLA